MNLILITIDCLRSDHLSCLGYTKLTTPNLDLLASKGAVFTQAISASMRTQPSFKAIFTSTYPLMHRGQLSIKGSRQTLAQVLREYGYHTAAFHSNAWLSAYFGYNNGFKFLYDGCNYRHSFSVSRSMKALAEYIPSRHVAVAINKLGELAGGEYPYWKSMLINPYATARDLNNRLLSWLDSERSNFFIWLHYMDAHEPYLGSYQLMSTCNRLRTLLLVKRALRLPESLSLDEIYQLISLYDGSIRYIDKNLGCLLHKLERNGVLDKTFIVLTSDHGQQFLEHGFHGHGGFHPWDELIRVPLIITGPGINRRVIARQVSLINLAPTILDLVHIKKPVSFQGHSLLPAITGKADDDGDSITFTEIDSAVLGTETADLDIHTQLDLNKKVVALRTEKWKYVYIEGMRDELYDLENDPKETQNSIDHSSEQSKELKAKILMHIQMNNALSEEIEFLEARIKSVRTRRNI